jgi:hypothetical protein
VDIDTSSSMTLEVLRFCVEKFNQLETSMSMSVINSIDPPALPEDSTGPKMLFQILTIALCSNDKLQMNLFKIK